MIWKALSDPTRRSILEKLKKAPQTTSELSSMFEPLSRYAVMKHLGILEKANLIMIRREGKFRWNYLNTAPIQRAYDQWLSNLVRFKYLTDQTSTSVEKPSKKPDSTAVSIEVEIKSPKQRIWQALTEQTGQWWLPSLFTHPQTNDFVLEAKLGGLMYERAASGDGAVWANVIGIDSPNFIQLKGHLTPALGGPAISFLRIELHTSGPLTIVRLKDEIFGDIASDLKPSLTQNWTNLLENGLKPFLEEN